MDAHHRINGFTIIGENFLETDPNGHFINRVAIVFPGHCLMVVSRGGIHASQILTAASHLNRSRPQSSEADLFSALCADAVSLNMNGNIIFIRTEAAKIHLALAADELLQQFVPKHRIQFTGLHLFEVRNTLRLRGENWRIAPAPVEERDFFNIIRHCRISIGTGTKYLYNKHTGEHVLTYAEFVKIRPLIRSHTTEALTRLNEIVCFYGMINPQGYPELVFLLPSDKTLDIQGLNDVIFHLSTALPPETALSAASANQAETLFDLFAGTFAALAGPELTVDNPGDSRWRAISLCRLYNIDERTTAEWAFGLGPEFYLNIRWLPGARITEENFVFDPDISPRVKSLITHYRRARRDFISINVGGIIRPLTERDLTGEEREVYIVTLGLPDGRKDIRHVRMSKWDVAHRLKKGLPLEQAITETRSYRDYIIDRLTAARSLGLPIPVFKEIHIEEGFGTGSIPVYYFEREYVPGIVTSRIPDNFYSRKDFLVRLAWFLGASAAASLVLGRKDPRSLSLYFDDGDELIQLNGQGLPERLMMIETTGSFADWTTPLDQMLPHCLLHLRTHMDKARRQGMDTAEILKSIGRFGDGLIGEILRMQHLVREPGSAPASLFSDRTDEPEGVRHRWQGILHRLRHTDPEALKCIIEEECRELQRRRFSLQAD